MIRLSEYAAVDIDSAIVQHDLDTVNLYVYSFKSNNRTQRQFVQADSTGINSREFAYGSYCNNIVLNPTPAFYPDQNISIGFHDNSELHVILDAATLPVMQFKTVNLMFAQGFGYDSNSVGTTIRCFVRLNNGREITLASIYDYPSQSNIIAASQKLFESQIFNTKLAFEIPDIDYIINSTDENINLLRTYLFGSEIPETIYFEYSNLQPSNVDSININGYDYIQLNLSVINSGSISNSISAADCYATLTLNDTAVFISSRLNNDSYDVASYMNKFKESTETFTVYHDFTLEEYNSSDVLIGTKYLTSFSTLDAFDAIDYRPIILDETDHFRLLSTIRVTNSQTGLAISKSSTLIIIDQSVLDNFRVTPNTLTLNLTSDKVYNKILTQVNQIVAPTETPDIIQITKPVYILVETAAETLTLLQATFTTRIKPNVSLTGVIGTYLKIDNIMIQNNAGDLTSFTIPAKAYYTTGAKYFLLNSYQEVINAGTIVRK
jgi:hypothetical protein